MFVIRRALGAKEIRPVPILETRAGLTEPTFRTVAPFALSAEALLKRFGGGGRQGDTHDKRADEQFDSHGALHVD
jgi:hypothetical protein